MKRSTRTQRLLHRGIALLMTASLLLTFSACARTAVLDTMKEEERAVYLYERMNEIADNIESATVKQSMELSMDVNGQDYSQVTDVVITYAADKEDYTYLEQSETTVRVGAKTTKSYMDRGYSAGVMFLRHSEDGYETKLSTPITAEDHTAYMKASQNEEDNILVGEGYSDTMTCVENEDGTWTATYEDFTEEGMKPFYRLLQGIRYLVTADHALKDVRLTCIVDKNFYPIEITFEYIFEKNPSASTPIPEVRVHTEYSQWNQTSMELPFDLDDFSEVEDLCALEQFLLSLNDWEAADMGSFEVKSSTTISYQGQTERSDVRQKVNFVAGENYQFTINSTGSGYKIDMTYRDGKMTTMVYDEGGQKIQEDKEDIKDYEAQISVQQLMDSESIRALDFSAAKVTDAEKGRYHLTLGDAVRDELDEQCRGSYGAGLDSFRGHVDVTMTDGKLDQYIYYIHATLTVYDSTLTITVSMTVDFTESTADGSTV